MIRQRVGQWSARAYFAISVTLISFSIFKISVNIVAKNYNIVKSAHTPSHDPKDIHANAAMRIEPVLKNTCLQDVIGGSVSSYDSMVKLVKV
jgi:hypothetical protein